MSETHGVKLCLFDKEGAELYDKHIWTVNKHRNTFYLRRGQTVNGKQIHIKFHRELLGLNDGEIRDHRNGNGLDNRLYNLRPSTHQENMCNQGIYKNNTSGIKGVSWSKPQKKWWGQIQNNKKFYHLGFFDDKDKAESAVRAKREELHKEFANHG